MVEKGIDRILRIEEVHDSPSEFLAFIKGEKGKRNRAIVAVCDDLAEGS